MYPQIQERRLIDLCEDHQPVLLELNDKDEAVRYYAQARAVTRAGEYVVYIAESSLLLDCVRLKPSLTALVSFGPNLRFSARLALTTIPAPSGSATVALSIIDEAPIKKAPENNRYCPLT